MTATITFEVDRRDNVVRIPSKALRYLPQDRKFVQEQDHDILDGRRSAKEEDSEDVQLSAAEKAAANRCVSRVAAGVRHRVPAAPTIEDACG
jgi:hypothetical protein